jgi:hypothetical protein
VGEQQATGAVAIVVDDVQWADRRSVEAVTFTLRRLSVDPVIAVMIYRGPSHRLDESAQRMLLSIENRLRLPLDGLHSNDVASLAAALTAGPLDDEAVQRLYRDTGGHPLYLRTDGWPSSAATRSRPGSPTSAPRTPPADTARSAPPGCCWPTAGSCVAPETRRARSSGCGGRTTCTGRCAPSRSSPAPKKS